MRTAAAGRPTGFLLLMIALVLGMALAPARSPTPSRAEPARQAAGATLGYLPDLQVPDSAASAMTLDALPAGMEGFGSSSLELVELGGDRPNAVEIRLQQWDMPDRTFSRSLAPHGHLWLDLADQLELGRFGAIVRAEAPVGMVVRSAWNSGALTVYERPLQSRELVLPMAMRGVGGQATILNVYNTHSVPDSSNALLIEVFDPSSGDFLVDVSDALEPEAVHAFDTTFVPRLRVLPSDVLGGFIGPMRLSAEQDVAVMAYGDDTTGDGSSAYLARPVERASTLQLLPALRAGHQGSSLVAIANVSRDDAVDVELDYRGLAPGEGMRAVDYEQRLRIPANGAAYIDLADRGRGNHAPPAGLLAAGYFGNLTVHAAGPVLAMAQEELSYRGHRFTASAYNAFGADEVGTGFSLPRALEPASGRSTQLIVMNPSPVTAELEIGYRHADGGFSGQHRASVPAGQTRVLPAPEPVPPGSRLELESSQPVAVLGQDTPYREEGYWDTWQLDTSLYPALLRVAAAIPTPDPNPTGAVEPSATPTTDPGAQRTPPAHAVHAPVVLRSLSMDQLPAPVTAGPTVPPSPTPTVARPTETPTATRAPATPTPTEPALPSRIHGRITIFGQPAPEGMGEPFEGPQIELRRRVGGVWKRQAYAAIEAEGRFAFQNPPPLAPGEAYQVWWRVDRDLFLEDLLLRWMSPAIEAFGPGDTIDVGHFEVGDDLELTRPMGGTRWALPWPFEWQPRSLATDDYRWALSRSCDAGDGDVDREDVFLSEPLGHVGRYRLRELPPGTGYGPTYCWWVQIEDGAGGRGWSTDHRRVGFCEEFPCDP